MTPSPDHLPASPHVDDPYFDAPFLDAPFGHVPPRDDSCPDDPFADDPFAGGPFAEVDGLRLDELCPGDELLGDVVREPPDDGPPPPRQHPWAGVTAERAAQWQEHRAAKAAARPSARARAGVAFEAFLASGGDGAAVCLPFAGDSEVAFELALLCERWARGLAGLVYRALAVFAVARAAEPDPARVAGRSGRPPEDYLGEEVALGFSLAPAAGRALLSTATELAGRLPATLAAVESGTLDVPRAHALLDVTSTLTDAQARTVEDAVLRRGARTSRAGFRRAARTAADRADPAAAADRAARRRDRRTVWKGHDHDGVASLGATLPAEVAQGIWQRVTGLARAALAPGDPRTLDQARADVYASLLLGRNTGDLARAEGTVVPVEIQVLVPVTTLAGLDDQPAHLAGHGPLPAELARTLAEHAHWRRILFDPADGTLVETASRRHATKAQRAHVHVRDQYCQHPGCPRLARDCDTDHTRPHHTGGPTDPANLGPACRRHHRMKDEDNGWHVEQPRPGLFTTTTPAGRTYTNQLEHPWTDPETPTGQPTTSQPTDPWKTPTATQPNF